MVRALVLPPVDVGVAMTLAEAAANMMRERALAIEGQLRAAVAARVDLAVSETWGAGEMTLRFDFVRPGDAPPSNCTLYLASKYQAAP